MLALRKERGEGRGSVASLKEKAARDRVPQPGRCCICDTMKQHRCSSANLHH